MEDILCVVTIFGLAVAWFCYGFWALRRKRIIENIPTSKISAMAMGLVELCGKVQSTRALVTPFSQKRCVLYFYKIYKSRSQDDSRCVASGDSSDCLFWLDDGTGRVLVKADIKSILVKRSRYHGIFCDKKGKVMPEHIRHFMKEKNIAVTDRWWDDYEFEFKEWYFEEGEEAYVLGTASYAGEDINVTRDKIGSNLLMISDYSARELLNRFKLHAPWGIFGGAILSLLCLAYLLWRIKWF